MITRRNALLIIAAATISPTAEAKGFLRRLGLRGDNTLSESTIRDGLREALTVGIERTIKHVGKKDGYLKSNSIKILLPKKFARVERPLRAMGQGDKVDAFILSMNRSAEAAAPLAKEIFINAIAQMSLSDAKAILNGKDTAATDYLNQTTRKKLFETFSPIVHKTMNQFSVSKRYDAVIGKTKSLPFAKRYLGTNIKDYTTNKALDGLFIILAEEEKRIRTKPVARTTDILRKVFAQ